MRTVNVFSLVSLFSFAFSCFAETHIPAGDVFGIWEAAGSPYYIDGEVHIPTDSMLLIEPGCSIIFTGHYKFCVDSNAVLRAIGTEMDSIVFTAQDTVLTDSTGGHHGIRFSYAADGCTLMYCRIEYGNAFGDYPDYYGGGIYCYHSSPTIENNTIIENSAALHGGGIYCWNYSSPIIVNNTISGNSAEVHGGGICCWDSSSPEISNNKINGNSAATGGGIYCWNSSPTISNNTISENSADWGGGILCWGSSPTIENNKISRNSAGYGGGIYCDNSNPTIINNTIIGNSADYGGGILCGYNSSPIISNNTISGNSADDHGGGVFCEYNSYPIIFNTILWQNTASTGNEIYVDYCEYGGTPYPCTLFVAYTDIDPGDCYVEGDTAGVIIWGDGNINADPLFADTLFHLSASSPCIDAGAESAYVSIWDTVIYAPEYDFEGGARPYGAGWDIGADEYGSSIIARHSENKPRLIEIFAYPNPFNSSCVIFVETQNLASLPTIAIYDFRGNVVYKLPPLSSNSFLPKEKGESFPLLGERETQRVRGRFTWAPDEKIPSGIYLVRATILQQNKSVICTKRIVYLK
ncbi:right-handed parallel beta-helix repeat-containing protein [bacterium]|nr:right-handed parallel beta-helix repeat-containing protein [bacterium]